MIEVSEVKGIVCMYMRDRLFCMYVFLVYMSQALEAIHNDEGSVARPISNILVTTCDCSKPFIGGESVWFWSCTRGGAMIVDGSLISLDLGTEPRPSQP